MATNIYKIGTTYAGLALLTSLSVPLAFPYHDYSAFSKVRELASGGAKGNGSPMLKWSWKSIRRVQRDYLRDTFCPYPAISSDVYIAQLDGEGDERAYLCKMIWPAIEDIQAERVLNFSLIFKRLEIVTS